MAPISITVLLLLGILILTWMWCLCCSNKGENCNRKLSTIVIPTTKELSGTLRRKQSTKRLLSRNSSLRSSIGSHSFDHDLMRYFGEEEEEEYQPEEVVVSGNRKLFTLSEEVDVTGTKLESNDWNSDRKSQGSHSSPSQQKCQNTNQYHSHTDFPSFYI